MLYPLATHRGSLVRSFALVLLGLTAFMAVGCEPRSEVRTYDVEITNHLSDPITVCLTKNGPPDETGWLSPEEIAENPMSHDPTRVGQLIPAGSTGRSGPVVGHFWPDTSAVVRIYRSSGQLEDFAALSFGNPKRLDVSLHPGVNELIIGTDQDRMTAWRKESQ